MNKNIFLADKCCSMKQVNSWINIWAALFEVINSTLMIIPCYISLRTSDQQFFLLTTVQKIMFQHRISLKRVHKLHQITF